MQACSWEVTLVRVESSLGAETTAKIRTHSSSLLAGPGHVIVDLRDAAVDSSGLCAVLSLARRLELQGRRLLVVATDPQLLSLLDRTGITGAFPLFRDMETAIQHTRKHSGLALAA